MRAVRILAGIFGSTVSAVLLLLALLQTSIGQRGLSALVSAAVSTPDLRVDIAGLHGFFPSDLTAERIELSGRSGPWLRIENARLAWTTDSLFDRRLQIDALSADRVEVLRPPEPGTARSGNGVGLSKPPVGIDLRSLSIGELHLAAAMGGVDSRWRLDGAALLARDLPDSRLKLVLDRTDGPHGRGSAEIRFDRATGQAIIDIAFEERTDRGLAANLLGRSDLETVSLKLHVQGDPAHGEGSLTLSAGDAMMARGEAGWHREDKVTRASLRITGSAPCLPDGPVARLLRRPLTLAADGLIDEGGVTVHKAIFEAEPGRVIAQGRYVFVDDALEAMATVELDETGVLAAFAGGATWRDLRAELKASLTGLSARPHGTMTASLVADQVVIAPAPVPALGKVDVSARLALQRDGHLLIEALTANSSPVSLKATGDFMATTPVGDAKVTILATDLSPFSGLAGAPLTGKASIDITVRSRSEGLQIGWQGRVLDFSAPSVPADLLKPEVWLAGAASYRHDRTWRLNASRVATDTATLTVEGRGRDTAGEIDFKLALPRLAALGFPMDGAATLDGKIVRQEDGVVSARLYSTGEFAGQPLQLAGSIVRDVEGGLSVPSLKGQWASATVDVADLAIGPKGTAGSARLHVKELRDLALVTGSDVAGTLDLEVATDLQAPDDKIRARLTGRNLRGVGEIDQFTARMASNLRTADVTLQASGGSTDARLAVNVQPTDEGIRFFLTRFEGRQGQVPVSLIAPARAHLVGSRLAIEQARFNVAGGTMALAGSVDPAASDLSIDIAAVPLAAARAFVPDLDLDGTLQAKLRLHGALASPQIEGTYAANSARLRRPEANFLPPLSLAGTGSLTGSEAVFDARLSGGVATALAIKGKATLPHGGVPLSLAAKLTGATDLALLAPAIGASVRGLNGRLQPDLDIAIAGDKVSASGTLALSGATLTLPDSGLRLERGEAALVLQDQAVQIQRLRFQTAAGGEITATGNARLDPAQGFPVDLQVTAKRALIVNRPDLVATVSSNVRVAGSLRGGFDISGPVTVDRADINIGLNQGANYPTFEAPPRPVDGPAVRLALTVEAPQAVFVRGRGLDAEVGGRLAVGGVASQPSVTGSLSLRRGDFNLAGRRLVFSRGNATLMRLDSIEPILDFLATASAGSTTVNVALTGSSRLPRIALSSVPSLSQDELMARLLFGRATSALGPFEILQVTQALAELTGIARVPGPVGPARQRPGIDRRLVESTGQEPSLVSAGFERDY